MFNYSLYSLHEAKASENPAFHILNAARGRCCFDKLCPADPPTAGDDPQCLIRSAGSVSLAIKASVVQRFLRPGSSGVIVAIEGSPTASSGPFFADARSGSKECLSSVKYALSWR
jgi:hypothetical protein